MKTKLFGLLFASALVASASTYAIGFEDWIDRDFNDTVIRVSSITIAETSPWLRPTASQLMFPNETPFPYDHGSFFDNAVATGDGIGVLMFQQTSSQETAEIKIGSGGLWMPVTSSGTSFAAAFGMPVFFRLHVLTSNTYLYPGAALNPDGMTHAIAAQLSPEPGTWLLMGAGIGLIWGVSRVRKG